MLNDDAHVAQTAALVIGNNNVALCSFARLLQAYRLLGVGAEILWRPGLGLATVCCKFCGIVSYDKSETTSGMQFVAILFISGLRLAIQKILISFFGTFG